MGKEVLSLGMQGWNGQEGNHLLICVNSNTYLLRGAVGQQQFLFFVFEVSVLLYSHTECRVKASVPLGQFREVS